MKLTASLNISIREAKTGSNVGSKFASIVGLLADKSKAIEFDVNGDAVTDLEAFAGLCRNKRVAPIVEIECEGVAAEPSMVTEQATGVKRARTWAGKPVYRLTGSATMTRVVATEPLPEVKLAETFMSSAAEALKV